MLFLMKQKLSPLINLFASNIKTAKMSLYYRRCIFLDHSLQRAADCNLQLRSCLLSSIVMSLHTKADFTISLFLFLFKGISAPKGLKITVIEPTSEDQMSQSHFEWENFIRPSRLSSVGL